MRNDESQEWMRIAFVADRDGVSAALAFAKQGVRQYEAAIREADSGGNQYAAVYREGLLTSIRVYRQYLAQKERPRNSPGTQ